MKIREGFVSNSSSSSFIVRDKSSKTKDVAIMMLKNMLENSDYEQKPRITKCNKAIQLLETLDSNFDEPIHIPFTCNYDTYIWRNDDYILIDSCNNEAFHDIFIGTGELGDDDYPSAEFLDVTDEDSFGITYNRLE